jgi:uncharacterized protein (DUF1778 family)
MASSTRPARRQATREKAGGLAYEGARCVLDEHERMILTGADRDAFLSALLNPPQPTEALVAALKRHRGLFG